MNIFKILSTGDGKVYEPSVSAFLAYLLDPNENHGLNDSFLKIFLKENNIRIKNIDLFASVETEVPFSLPEEKENENAKKRDIDIVIELLNNDGKIEQIIFIENKIKNSAYNKSQIIDQGKIIENYMTYFSTGDVETQKKKNEKIFVSSFIKNHILLLPDTKMTEDVRKDFGTLVQCITWEHVYNQLVTILKSEHDASIDPVFEYTKHTIKAFAQFIKSGFKSRLIEKKELSEKLKYKKPVLEYIRDIYNDVDFWNSEHEINENKIKLALIDRIRNSCGIEINAGTRNAQVGITIVNKRSRTGFPGYCEEATENQRNLFYYVVENGKNREVKRLPLQTNFKDGLIDLSSIKIYIKEYDDDGHKKSTKFLEGLPMKKEYLPI